MNERKVLVTVPAGGLFWGLYFDPARGQWYARIDHPIHLGDMVSAPKDAISGGPNG